MDKLEKRVIRLGSRKSQLAVIQTQGIKTALEVLYPHIDFQMVTMSTTGDKILDKALSKIGEKSLFTKELENCLLDHSVDLVVHSLKDLPTQLPPGLVIGAVNKRMDPRDAIVMHPKYKDMKLKDLPPNSVVGTSSLRRSAQLKQRYPHLQIDDIRGNLNTRLRKLDEDDKYACIVLALAGLERMGWGDRATEILDPLQCMYAVSQGALGVECREDDHMLVELISRLNHPDSIMRCVAERAFLRTLEGGCSVPVAAHTYYMGKELHMIGGVFSLDGQQGVVLSHHKSCPREHIGEKPHRRDPWKQFSSMVMPNLLQTSLEAAEVLGVELAEKVAKAGGTEILDVAKKVTADAIKEQHARKMELLSSRVSDVSVSESSGGEDSSTN